MFRKGWVRGYDLIFTEAFKIPLAEGPVPIAVLEDIALTRNSIRHDREITTNRPKLADGKPGSARRASQPGLARSHDQHRGALRRLA